MPHSIPLSHTKPVRQCVVTRKGGPFQIITTDYPQPGPDEICIRNRAVGLSPVDLFALDNGMTIRKYPEVLGTDVAGVIEVVGSQVTAFKAGDAVMAVCPRGGGKYAAFQDITTIPAELACRKPASWSFAEAASVPTAYLTAYGVLSNALSLPLPHLLSRPHLQTPNTDPSSEYLTALRPPSPPARLPQSPTPTPELSSVLVMGGSTPLGAAAIQLLRLSLPPGTPIISTNPAAHDARVTGVLGATACVDGADMAYEEVVAAGRTLRRRGIQWGRPAFLGR
ncbi:chaperonin 10-like protein [Schizothecium vesticola]|uniref:Chaperonin 10-like protein n=1 Tax=Schizothecium vesticola TaxID=314040 RepID=A0AA40EHS8_9PEZI|nr:chaperonin 10-like protein [Schizothecium vesticola]